MDFQDFLPKMAVLGANGEWVLGGAMLAHNELVYTFGGCYLWATFGENRSRKSRKGNCIEHKAKELLLYLKNGKCKISIIVFITKEICSWLSPFHKQTISPFSPPTILIRKIAIRKVVNGHSFILICQMAALVKRALAEVCTVPVLLVSWSYWKMQRAFLKSFCIHVERTYT